MTEQEHILKIEWMKSLKVGDIVCDCRGKHLKIESMDKSFRPKFHWLIANICYNVIFCSEVLYNKFRWLFGKLGMVYLTDIDVTLEDGGRCSIMNCCESPDHEWSH